MSWRAELHWEPYLQPAATLLVAMSLGAIAVDQNRTSTVRLKCAQVYAGQVANKAAHLGLKVRDGNSEWSAISGYCGAFLPPRVLSVDITELPADFLRVHMSGYLDTD